MFDPALQHGRLHARRVLIGQIVLGGLIAGSALGWLGREAALASAIGMIAVVLPGWYFARRALGTMSGARPRERLGALYKGEIGKWVLTVSLLLVAVHQVPRQMPILMMTYIACVALHWAMLAVKK